MNRNSLIGKQYGQWLVLSEPSAGKVQARCNGCRRTFSTLLKNLQTGMSTQFLQCARQAYWRQKRTPAPIGQIFGDWIVLQEVEPLNQRRHVEAQCQSCGRKLLVNLANLTRGLSQGCTSCSLRDRHARERQAA